MVEVISKSSKSHDTFLKYHLYQKCKVKEYWIVDVEDKIVEPYQLNQNGIYELPKKYQFTEEIKVQILEDCKISLKDFAENEKETK